MINEAKKAVAGLQMMSEVIDNIRARRPDIVEDALEKVLGIKEGASEEAFNAAMDSRVEEVTHFDKYTDRVAELESTMAELLDDLSLRQQDDIVLGSMQKCYRALGLVK